MEYFSQLPNIYYDFIITPGEKSEMRIIKDISFNVRFVKEVLNDITLYDEYDIKDGETPEIVSEKFYGSPIYHWIIMLMNEVYDVSDDWPLSSGQFQSYIEDMYANINDVHHLEDSDGYEINSTAKYYDPYGVSKKFLVNMDLGSVISTANTSGEFGNLDLSKVIQISGVGLPWGLQSLIVSIDGDQMTMSRAATETVLSEIEFIDMIDPIKDSVEVTNLEYETKLNESKRRIKILHPSLLDSVLQQLRLLADEQ